MDAHRSFWDSYGLHLTQLDVKSIKSPFYFVLSVRCENIAINSVTHTVNPLNGGNSNYLAISSFGESSPNIDVVVKVQVSPVLANLEAF